MRRLLLSLLFCAAALPAADWKLVWSDEFNGPKGSAPDAKTWGYDRGAGGWGNHELENYTDSRANSFLDGDGHLVIRAIRTETDGKASYTSARLLTKGRYAVKYGRIEARLKLPAGQGIWPAFWMLGDDVSTAGWPRCGEIDIMEYIGKTPDKVYFTLHGPGYSAAKGISTPRDYPAPAEFHTYGIDWAKNSLTFLFDGAPVRTLTPADLPAGTKWVYDHPHFILLNLAVGGGWPGNPDATTVFPQDYVIDYVRVYQREQ
jgi:beta-glucanase (GH16 family)